MLDEIVTRPLGERKILQAQYGATRLPQQDLCYATYTTPCGETFLVDIIATNEDETSAVLSCWDERTRQRLIWHAYRNQQGRPGTWLWTEQQLANARQNPLRIRDSENDFRDDEIGNIPIQITPGTVDRRTEILLLGLHLNKSDGEVRARLRREGYDDRLPANYRTVWNMGLSRPGPTPRTGALDLGEPRRITEPLLNLTPLPKKHSLIPARPLKFSGRKKPR